MYCSGDNWFWIIYFALFINTPHLYHHLAKLTRPHTNDNRSPLRHNLRGIWKSYTISFSSFAVSQNCLSLTQCNGKHECLFLNIYTPNHCRLFFTSLCAWISKGMLKVAFVLGIICWCSLREVNHFCKRITWYMSYNLRRMWMQNI